MRVRPLERDVADYAHLANEDSRVASAGVGAPADPTDGSDWSVFGCGKSLEPLQIGTHEESNLHDNADDVYCAVGDHYGSSCP